ncbi:MAG: peptide deformylase [Phycisphaerales bacterium JB043]
MSIDPGSLSIVSYPDPVLKRKAEPVDAITDEVRAVALRMIDLMHEAEGIGLAAPQVGLSWRLFVAHVPPDESRLLADDPMTATEIPLVFLNPRLHDFEGDLEPFEEGCLSLPDIRGEVRRPPRVSVSATDLEGSEFTLRTDDLLARCMQHEHDHLDGVLIIDRMTQLSRMKTRSAIKNLEAMSHHI